MAENQSFLDLLSEAQHRAVTHGDGPLLITAGAGSGKTRALTNRLMHLIMNGVDPQNIVAITFTNKAAGEMKRRLGSALEKANWHLEHLPFVGTFHSFGALIMRKEAYKIGRTPNFAIFDSDDSLQIVKKILEANGGNLPTTPQAKRALAMKIQRDISKAKNELHTAEDLTGETQKLFRAYEQELVANNALDFDDLLEKPVRIFQQNPETLEKYASKIHYILIDEYQDTNVSQYMLVKLLGKRHGNVTAVGDDQQSIYKFRGSDFRNFLTFERDWPNATIVELGQNYRSTSTIVNAAAGVIAHNEFQRPKRLWTENSDGEPVKVLGSRSADEEALRIVHHILTLRTQNQHNTAILYRTNAQSRALESALHYNGVPYVMFGGLKFYDRKEIKDITSAIRYASNPKDSVSKDRIEKTFTKKIREALVAGLPGAAAALNPVELIGYFMKTADYETHLQSKSKNSEERMENIQELIKFATTFADVPSFLERISLFESSEQPKTGGNGNNPVVLMTIHLAKGLEFDHICIAGVNDDTLPHRRSLNSKEDLEEERRLMYVAMTRAKKTLVVSFFGLASRFLGEIPPELVEVSDGSWRLDDEPRSNEWRDYDSGDDIYLD